MKALLAVAGAALVLGIAELAHLQLLAALWIPFAMLLFLVAFPLYAVTGQSTLFWGLFDLPLSPNRRLPIRHYFVTLSAFSVAASAVCMIQLVVKSGPERFQIPAPHLPDFISRYFTFGANVTGGPFVVLIVELVLFSTYFAAFALVTSWTQDKTRSLASMIAGVLAALATGCAGIWLVARFAIPWIENMATATVKSTFVRWLGPGFENHHWAGHLTAMLASLLAIALYAGLGLYGRRALGKTSTVAALIGPLMLVLVLGWVGSAMEFFLSRWHIPLLLVVAVLGWINSRFPWTDHTYDLLPRNQIAAARPYAVLTAGNKNCAILVASAGGGIQAAAWTAKVLEELHLSDFGKDFDRALCLISSISGGSMGSACYIDWLRRGAIGIRPFDAASASSLDEVSWGLAWPDLLRVLLPWPIRIDRAIAMERAWKGNIDSESIDAPLSDWNASAAQGSLPAVVMNSTMVEVGGPLLLGTTDVNGDKGRKSSCWSDGDSLHVDQNRKLDVPVVRAARLSATFPFVTPAARPLNANHVPHMMDGGFYDNYGMATLTEWLDQALTEQQKNSAPGSEPVKRVLILQINGFPPANFDPPKPPPGSGGWISQLLDPVQILANVRTAGQVSHRDVELKLLTDKWQALGIHIENVDFELQRENAPLSWHLMPTQIADIAGAWTADKEVRAARDRVEKFLNPPPAPLNVRVEIKAGIA